METPSVLYVEDEEDSQMLVQRILGKDGIPIQLASTGEEGLSALQKIKPDLLILDVNLPDTDGYSLCQKLRQDPEWRHLPIVMLTVRRRPDEWLKGFSCGANDYVPKPLDPPELVSRVRASLAGKPGRRGDPTCLSTRQGPEYLLILAAVAGNRAAYEVLVQQYKERLMQSLRASGKSDTDDQDL